MSHPSIMVAVDDEQLAVLRVVGDEIADKGVCVLCINAIAARAGVTTR